MRNLLAQRVSSAAIRIPDAATLAATPSLFIHEGSRQALERKLRTAWKHPVVLAITDTGTSMVSFEVENWVLSVRLHHMFLDAPDDTVDALVNYIVSLGNDKDASGVVNNYISNQGSRFIRKRQTRIEAKGAAHDLAAIYDRLNEQYFNGEVDATITWSRRASRDRAVARQTVRLGSYSYRDRLIRINPVLDKSWVPRYFVAYVIYHEMLHHVFPAQETVGRRCLHSKEFVAREREFRWHARTVDWERRNVSRLLRSR